MGETSGVRCNCGEQFPPFIPTLALENHHAHGDVAARTPKIRSAEIIHKLRSAKILPLLWFGKFKFADKRVLLQNRQQL